MKKIKNPHDLIAKKFLDKVDMVRDFLDVHLPENIKKICELNTLEVCPDTFISDELTEQFSGLNLNTLRENIQINQKVM